MKKIFTLLVCALSILSMILPVSASETGKTVYYSEEILDNGIVIISEVIDHSQARTGTKNYEHSKTYVRNGITIGVVSIYGSFRYDGSSVSVLSKRVTQTDTYDGWNYSQTSFSSSGGTITLSAKLTKPLNSSIPITMTLSCDANGNISYT